MGQWQEFLKNMSTVGYLGSYDIEIGCKPEKVRQEYTDGLIYLQSCLWEEWIWKIKLNAH